MIIVINVAKLFFDNIVKINWIIKILRLDIIFK